MNATERNDADLVADCLAGRREAFRVIVERYQTLICSLAYNATGNLSQSEDVAQETFLAAWKDLRSLREPEKLRAWLCGIVRNRTHRSLRNEGREPVCNAAPLEDAPDAPMIEPLPSEQTISREEEAILWRSLEKIPELYREPLILFYRQHQSVEKVAQALELSEDAVKQRLVRGRKLLQEEVQVFVETTLGRTSPSHTFSIGVLSALPVMPASTMGVGVAGKSAAVAKSGFIAAWLLPFLGFLTAFASQWIVIDATTPPRDRRAKQFRLVITWICLLGFPIIGETSVRALGHRLDWGDRTCFATVAGFWWVWCMVLATWLSLQYRSELAKHMKKAEISEPNHPASVCLTSAQSILVSVGGYMAIFCWVISLAWREHDAMGLAVIIAAVLVLGLGNFVQRRDKTGVAALRAAYSHMTLCCAVVVAFINLRLDVWAARQYGVSVAEVHSLLPFWIIPILSLCLAAWIAVLLAMTKSQSRQET